MNTLSTNNFNPLMKTMHIISNRVKMVGILTVLITFFILFFSGKIYAQPGGGLSDAKSNFGLVPKSPEAARYEIFGNLAVNPSSGVPNVQVPIHTISLKDFKWDINLGYNAKGVKVDDMASNVGLGWNLNINGLISATVYSRSDLTIPYDHNPDVQNRDLDFSSYSGCNYYNNTDIFAYANPAANNQKNYIPDIYSINIGNLNYKMFFKNDNTGAVPSLPTSSTYTGYTLPASNTKINMNTYFNSGGDLDSAKISLVDGTGNKYYLRNRGYNKRISLCSGREGVVDPNYVFYLDSIRTFKGEKIAFTYGEPILYNYYNTPSQVLVEKLDTFSEPCAGLDVSSYNDDCDSRFSALEPVLTTVTVSNGTKITLEYGSRTDLPDFVALNRVKIAYQQTPLKTIEFDQSYFGSGSNPNDIRLKLNKVKLKNPSNTSLGEYTFDYNATALPNRLSLAVDSNGYFNNVSNTSLVPYGGGVRTSDIDYTKAAILEKITYPSGGYTALTYEPSRLENGGLRVKSVLDYDGTNQLNKKYYSYGNQGVSGCSSWDQPSTVYFFWEAFPGDESPELVGCEIALHRSSNFCTPYGLISNPEPFYAFVTEDFDTNGANGKIEYTYDWQDTFAEGMITMLPIELKQKITYKNIAGNFYPLVKEVSTYQYIVSGSIAQYADVTGVKEQRIFGKEIVLDRDEMYPPGTVFPTLCYPKQFRQESLRFASIPYYLKEKEVWNYDQNGTNPVYTKTENFYDNDFHGQATRIENTSSTGKIITVRNYPLDYAQTGFIANLTSLNYLEEPVEEININQAFSQNLLKSGYVNTYYSNGLKKESYVLDNLGNPAPINLSGFRFSNLSTDGLLPYQSAKSAFSYDNRYYSKKNEIISYGAYSTPKQITIEDKVSLSYQWGYNNQYPIAEVSNAVTNEFYVENFEEGSLGTTGAAHTGNKFYNGDFALNFSIPNGKAYSYSYWYKSSGVWLFSGELYYTGSVNLTSGDAIDDVRVLPKDAEMTTYTYQPLVGMSSMIYASGKTTYYEYDSFQRLQYVRDTDKKIVNAYCYNYAGFATDCLQDPPPLTTTVYARLEVEYIYPTSYYYPDPFDLGTMTEEQYANVYIRFYSDENGTIPVTLTENMEVNINEILNYNYYGSGSGQNQYSSIYTVPLGVNSYDIGPRTVYYNSTYFDPYYYTYVNDSYDYSFEILAHPTQTKYIPIN